MAMTAPTPIPTANVVYLLDHLLWLIASVLCIKFFDRWYFDRFFNAGSTRSHNYQTASYHAGRKRIYLPRAFSALPTLFWTFPAIFSARPLPSRSGLFVNWPAFSLILPFTS